MIRPDIFIQLGRSIADAFRKVDERSYPKWRSFFHAMLAYTELLFSNCDATDQVYDQLQIAGNLAKKSSFSASNYMKIFSKVCKKAANFSAKWNENPVIKHITCFLQEEKDSEINKVSQIIIEDKLAYLKLYIDHTWLAIEIIKWHLFREQYETAFNIYQNIVAIKRKNDGFVFWTDFLKNAFLITSISTNEVQKLLNPLENMAKLLLSASIEGNYDFVAGGGTIFWNLLFPKLKEAPQKAEIIRIFEIVHKALLKSSNSTEQLRNCFENEISLYYGVLSTSRGVTSEEMEMIEGKLFSIIIAF